jgi:hypothetical protein
MKQSKFSLADLLTVLGATGFGFFCFLSFNFLSMGKTMPSIGKAAIIALVLGGLAFCMKLFKKTNGNFKNCIIWEWVLLLMFAACAIVAVFPFSHYFKVLEQKKEIKKEVTTNITQVQGMFDEYEKYADSRESIYKSHLNSVVLAKPTRPGEYRDYGFIDGTPDSQQLENKTFSLHVQLFPTNYDDTGGVKKVATDWLEMTKHTLESNWAFTFGIVNVVNNVQVNTTGWKEQLIQFSAFRAKGESTSDFEYPLSFNDVTDKFTKLGSPTSISIAIAIGLYVLMLLIYAVSKRSTKNHYSLFSFLAGKKKTNKNDIDINY